MASRGLHEESAALVRLLYEGLLRREPDEEGWARWTKAVVDGLPLSEVAKAFATSDEFRTYGPVKLYVPPGHFYSPIVNPTDAERALAAVERKPIPVSVPGVTIDRAEMVRTWQALLPHLSGNAFPRSPTPGFRYAYENGSYSWGDGSVLQAMICWRRPKRIIEIGNGWSSACMIDTVELYLTTPCDLTFIDPYPQLLHQVAGDALPRLRSFEYDIQAAPLEMFDELESDDILFIDSTHVLRTGSDVCFELFEILPRLAPGVFVHFHDMFWPFEYPRPWAVGENRSWNELYAVRAFLTDNEKWEVVMFSDYLAKLERPMIEATWPMFLLNSGGALWLRRR
jgi:hypothetical protein